jgi:hypothetical protein
MNKAIYLLAVAILATHMISCDKVNDEIDGVSTKSAYVLNPNSSPVSAALVTPVILGVDKPKGGNVTCQDVQEAFKTSFDKCGDRINYGDFDGDGDFEFYRDFDGVDVEITGGKFIEFTVKNDPGSCLKVGAVIVKGSNSANVYYYPDGILHDSGLASPINSSGTPAGLSNLTFCLFESEPELPEVVIAVKAWYGIITDGTWSYSAYTLSTGANVFNTDDWCSELGVNYFPTNSSFALSEGVGSVNVDVGWPNGVRSLIITLELNDGLTFSLTHLYVGSLAGLGNLTECPDYGNWPYKDNSNVNTQVFIIPY